MANAYTRSDALKLLDTVTGDEIKSLLALGTIPGVVILAAAGRNGPGTGQLCSTGNGTQLTWRAPGSSTYGTATETSGDGNYLLSDGEDIDKWVRVAVYTDYLLPTPVCAQVFLAEVYNNALAQDNVSASEAAAGDTLEYTIGLHNQGFSTLTNLALWIDPACPWLSISKYAPVSWVQPTHDYDALVWPSLPAGTTNIMWIKRALPPGISSYTDVRNHLHFSWTGN